jgi:predicted RecA/RadA family phage recombinase
MATNYLKDGTVVTMTAPYAVAAGGGMKCGALFAVALAAAAINASVEGQLVGEWNLAKTGAQAVAIYTKLYWDDAAKLVTTTVGANMFIGVATAAALAADPTVRIRLNGIGV